MVGETMELKDLILSTLEELDHKIEEESNIEKRATLSHVEHHLHSNESESVSEDEKEFLLHSKERLEVLFSGLKSDENREVEEKLKLVIDFLQFYLTQIDKRLAKTSHA
jgi:hypothetical protein